MIDLRSDTVTRPTDEMRRAMYEAEVGDDVYGDDPTAARLERIAAEIIGKEAALFVPSGTMGNQIAIMTHTRRGDEIHAEERSHVAVYEVGASAVLSGVQMRTIRGEHGVMAPEEVKAAIRSDNIHFPPTGLLCLENALGNGSVVSLERMNALRGEASKRGVPVHLDGARIFNAAHALGCEGREIADCADSVMFCLSKGLSAPVGSMLAGTKEFVGRARKNRKLLGGGMRQVGVLAAAGIVALETMRSRLADDHAHAKLIASRISSLPGVTVKEDCLSINMVFFRFDNPGISCEELSLRLMERGIRTTVPDGRLFRLVTHREVTDADAETVCRSFEDILAVE